MEAALTRPRVVPGWLRAPAFDLGFIVGVTLLAVLAGFVAASGSRWLELIVILDLWLLGYHHVISTYTRLCFDAQSLKRHWFLVFGLPPIVLAAVVTLVLGFGAWAVVTIYFYWQWFHYTRQSWGVSRAYRGAAGGKLPEAEWLNYAVIYVPATWGVLSRSGSGFRSVPFHAGPMIAVPELVVTIAGIASAAVVGAWIVLRLGAVRRGNVPMAHTLYVVSHVVVFFIGYIVIDDITAGWVVANVWHNAQYILFVWWFNNQPLRGAHRPNARVLSLLSQGSNFALYMGVCLAISSCLYTAIAAWLPYIALPALAAAAIVYQTINFHHYIVDAVIWRRRKAATG